MKTFNFFLFCKVCTKLSISFKVDSCLFFNNVIYYPTVISFVKQNLTKNVS